jgi:hypothetical protein
MVSTHRTLINDLATRHRLPAIGAFRYMTASGMLVSYGADVPDLSRRVADYAGRRPAAAQRRRFRG